MLYAADMGRYDHLSKVRLPKEERLANLGSGEPLAAGEVSVRIRVRLPAAAAANIATLSPKELGVVLLAGMKRLQYATE